jgi:adenylate cyclase
VDIGRHASLSSARDIAFSWAVDSPNGFTDAEIEVIERLTPTLMLVVNAARNVATGRVLLGTDAAERMLSGNVVRGEAEPIRAAIWFSDLADFTRISDGAPAPEWQALSNISPQGQRIIELGFCEGNPRPTARISSRSNLADRAKA